MCKQAENGNGLIVADMDSNGWNASLILGGPGVKLILGIDLTATISIGIVDTAVFAVRDLHDSNKYLNMAGN